MNHPTPALRAKAKDESLVSPLLIYIHIPFCRSKCHFCDWVQPIPKEDLLRPSGDEVRTSYVRALCSEIRMKGRQLENFVPEVIYWGGGTASILSSGEMETIVEALQDTFDLSKVLESTIECSPDTVTYSNFCTFQRFGFNRVSIGAQSMDDAILRTLGRLHTKDDVVRSVEFAHRAGFSNINVDIMCGFPNETLRDVESNLNLSYQLPISHLSVYPFRPTGGTVISKQIDLGNANSCLINQLKSFEFARRSARSAGFNEYASGYFGTPALNVKSAFQLKLSVIGFGSGAISLLDKMYHGHTKGRLHDYIKDPISWDFSVPAQNQSVTTSLLRSGLSVFEGLNRIDWLEKTGVTLESVLADESLSPLIKFLRTKGQLIEDEQCIRLPEKSAGRTLIELIFRSALAGRLPPTKYQNKGE